MAKTFTAPFGLSPRTVTAVVTAAVTGLNTDSPTNTELLLEAGPEGSVFYHLSAMPRATISAAGLYLFVSDDGGVTKRLRDSALMPGHAVEATTAIPKTDFTDISEDALIRLAPGESLYVGTGVALADGIVFTGEAVDY